MSNHARSYETPCASTFHQKAVQRQNQRVACVRFHGAARTGRGPRKVCARLGKTFIIHPMLKTHMPRWLQVGISKYTILQVPTTGMKIFMTLWQSMRTPCGMTLHNPGRLNPGTHIMLLGRKNTLELYISQYNPYEAHIPT